MADIERIYTVPLRDARYRPRNQRARGAVTVLRKFIARHMKADLEKVWVDNPVNEALWARGAQKPPRRLRVKAVKFEEDGVVEVSLPEVGAESRRLQLAEAADAHRAATGLVPKALPEEEEGEEGEEEEEAPGEEAAEEEAAPAEAEEEAAGDDVAEDQDREAVMTPDEEPTEEEAEADEAAPAEDESEESEPKEQ